jgi:hypothetical protein
MVGIYLGDIVKRSTETVIELPEIPEGTLPKLSDSEASRFLDELT